RDGVPPWPEADEDARAADSPGRGHAISSQAARLSNALDHAAAELRTAQRESLRQQIVQALVRGQMPSALQRRIDELARKHQEALAPVEALLGELVEATLKEAHGRRAPGTGSAGWDRKAPPRARRGDPRPLLPGLGDPGPRGFRGRFAPALAAGGEDERKGDRVLWRSFHGGDREDPEPEQAGPAAGPGRRLLARRPLPARPVREVARGLSGPQGRQLHQLLRRREGAQRRHLYLEQCGEDRQQFPAPYEDRLRAR